MANIFSYLMPLVVKRLFDFKTALFLALFPTYVLYTTMPYAESIALFFAAAALLYATKRPLLSSVFFSPAVLIKYNLALGLPAFLKTWRLRHISLPLATVVAVALWHTVALGSPLAYFEMQRKYWGAEPAAPIQQIQWLLDGWFISYDWRISSLRITPEIWLVRNLAFEILFFIGATALKGLYLRYTLLESISLLFTIGTPAISIPRLLLSAFPALTYYSRRINTATYITATLLLMPIVTIWHIQVFCVVVRSPFHRRPTAVSGTDPAVFKKL